MEKSQRGLDIKEHNGIKGGALDERSGCIL